MAGKKQTKKVDHYFSGHTSSFEGNCGLNILHNMERIDDAEDWGADGETEIDVILDYISHERIHVFTDSSRKRNGLPLAKALRKYGYRVDQLPLGKSPSTGSYLWMYIFWPYKTGEGRKKSRIIRPR